MTYSRDDFSNARTKAQLRHAAEMPLHVVSVILSLAVYAFLVWLVVFAPSDESVQQLFMDLLEIGDSDIDAFMSLGSLAIDITAALLFVYVIWSLFEQRSHAMAFDVRVSDAQLSRFVPYRMEFAEKLGLRPTPEVFATSDDTDIEIFDVTFKSRQFIRISSDLAKGPYEDEIIEPGVPFFIAREMGHIYLGHASILLQTLTFGAKLLPLYKKLYSRAMNYSADRVAKALVGDSAAIAVGMTLVNPEMLYNLDPENLFHHDFEQIDSKALRAGMVYENIFSHDPIPTFRVEALLNDSRNGRLF